ncbi:hypothetical protein HCJ76_44150 [Streptomyces sp. MC1]|uniref:hypothetical protein n=1 Tax=Streptomyces sp. MC1 TaxID=295105 RepID=UPI0018C9BA2A|nr:hypothetical protein [Streptomyces sp. MC1]MBG7704877.1 hypothetical protein [Streptomyces sp. MC1]
MSNTRERDVFGTLLMEQVMELGAALEPFGQTLLTMDPDSWPSIAVTVRVAHRGFEVALKFAQAAGIKNLTMERLADEYNVRVEAREMFPDGPPRIGPQ